MIELVWRNPAYELGLQEHGALFGGFRTEVNSDYESGRPGKKTRTEYKKFDRQFVYPGFIEDSKNAYHIGNSEGWDPSCVSAAGSMPPDMQMPRAVLTSTRRDYETPAGFQACNACTVVQDIPKRVQSQNSYSQALQLRADPETRAGLSVDEQNIHMYVDESRNRGVPASNTPNEDPVDDPQPAQNGTPFNPHTWDTRDATNRAYDTAANLDRALPKHADLPSANNGDMNDWGAEPDCRIRRLIKQSQPFETSSGLKELQDAKRAFELSSDAVVEFVDDVEWHNAGSTMLDMHLDSHVGGSMATLKKIVLQFSKEDHQISEVAIDLSDILRNQGSINGATAGQPAELVAKTKPEITILCDGKKRVQEVYYDTQVGFFTTNKFKLGVSRIRYFPPLVGTTGGFDNGSHVATITPTFGGLQPTTEASVATSQHSLYGPYATLEHMAATEIEAVVPPGEPNPRVGVDRNNRIVQAPINRSTSAQACSPFYAQVIMPDDRGVGVFDGRNTNVRAIPFAEASTASLKGTTNERAEVALTPEQVLFDNCDHLSRNLHFPAEAPAHFPENQADTKILGHAQANNATESAAPPPNKTMRVVQTASNVRDATMPPAEEAPKMTRFYDKSLQMAIANSAAVNRGTSITAKPTYSSFTVAPRKTNGTLLAVNITLESRAV